MTVQELCAKTGIAPQALKYVDKVYAPQSLLRELTNIESASAAYEKLKELCGDDGLKMLAVQLDAAMLTYEKYRTRGIDDGIFTDTFSCFAGFVNEHMNSYGFYDFDRGWWTYKQLAFTIFRIGELEYEYRDGEKTVHLHIPSDADISIEKCKSSLDEFMRFTSKFFPDKNYPIVCDSWLLSPALDELLSPQSKILAFKRCFEITDWDKSSTAAIHWVYGKQFADYNELPENTSLQRNMKAYLLKDGAVGSASGRLTDFI